MISNPNTIGSPVPVHNAETPPLLRLQLDQSRLAELNLDGAFWPRSRELSMELPALLAALSADLGAVALVGYHRDAWNASPGRIALGGNDIRLQSFVSPGPPTMVVIADSGRCVNLRVVPPDTDVASAAQAMSVATHRSSGADIDGQARRAATVEARSLEEVATRLARLPANSGPGRAAVISQWIAEAAEQFSNAPIQVFVPILVEHIVRGRLQNAQA